MWASLLMFMSLIANGAFASGVIHYRMSIKQVVTQQSVTKKIHGTVIDNSGGTIPGVTVRIKGKTKGVITGIDGTFWQIGRASCRERV